MNREPSLDALRGIAIVGMVLSGSIAFGGILPAWVYHALVPPPLHQFDPSIPGITWVDLVFPFFLFSMGAAFPLSLRGAIDENRTTSYFVRVAAKRFFLLAFFALFTQHMKAWVIAPEPGIKEQLFSLLAFILLFGIFYWGWKDRQVRYGYWIQTGCFLIAVFLLAQLPFHSGKGFDLYKSDIILMVLANMAFFGSLIYFFTANRPLLRLLILPVVAAIILSARESADSPVKSFFTFQELAGLKFDWLYKFYFLKYLFIVIPGTFAGEWMMHPTWTQVAMRSRVQKGSYGAITLLLVLGLLFLLLYRNHPLAGEGISVWALYFCCSILFWYWLRPVSSVMALQRMVQAGLFLLLFGLLLEPYEGGIKKDPSTFSYYFVCSGLAFLILPLLRMLGENSFLRTAMTWLQDVGKNPMLAYVAGSLLILPILSLTELKPYWDSLTKTSWQGLLKGVLFTSAVICITRYTVKKKWFWKT